MNAEMDSYSMEAGFEDYGPTFVEPHPWRCIRRFIRRLFAGSWS